MQMKTAAIILGTRPEIIKLAPVIIALQKSHQFKPLVVSSGQHKELAEQAFRIFDIKPDCDLQLMTYDQSPNTFLGSLLPTLENALSAADPDLVLVQGDTTTALGGALTAFHQKRSLGHVEAGLRTHNLLSPFPEEMNRSLISRVADFHFCPTKKAVSNLHDEGIERNVHLVGNTVVDALQWIDKLLESDALPIDSAIEKLQLKDKKFILVTGHRRENFDTPLSNLCGVLRKISEDVREIEIIYPVHLNPNVHQPVHAALGNLERIHLVPPLDYPTLLYLMKHSSLIISDSGGIQEEAPSFGRKVFVTRDTTERPEAIEAGTAELTSLEDPDLLYSKTIEHLRQKTTVQRQIANPFGDGTAAEKTVSILEQAL